MQELCDDLEEKLAEEVCEQEEQPSNVAAQDTSRVGGVGGRQAGIELAVTAAVGPKASS